MFRTTENCQNHQSATRAELLEEINYIEINGEEKTLRCDTSTPPSGNNLIIAAIVCGGLVVVAVASIL